MVSDCRPTLIKQFLIIIAVEWSVPDEVQKDDQDVKIVIQNAPIGVIGGIVPWNFPFQLAIIKIAPALLVGCTMILKPS